MNFSVVGVLMKFCSLNRSILRRRKPGIFPGVDVLPGGILLAARRQW